MLLQFLGGVLRLVDGQSFLKLLEDLSLDLAHALLASRRLHVVHWLEFSCIRWFPYYLAKGAVQKIEDSAVLGRKRGRDGEQLTLQNLSEVQRRLGIGMLPQLL